MNYYLFWHTNQEITDMKDYCLIYMPDWVDFFIKGGPVVLSIPANLADIVDGKKIF